METLETVYCREKNYKHIVNEGRLKDKDFGDVFLFKTTNSHPPALQRKRVSPIMYLYVIMWQLLTYFYI